MYCLPIVSEVTEEVFTKWWLIDYIKTIVSECQRSKLPPVKFDLKILPTFTGFST